jgi:hypothetical protein
VHHACDAPRTMRSMPRTTYDLQTRKMQDATPTTRYPNGCVAVTNTALAQMQLVLRSIQRASHKMQACNVQRTTCNAQHPSAAWTIPLATKAGVIKPATYNKQHQAAT